MKKKRGSFDDDDDDWSIDSQASYTKKEKTRYW